MSAATEADANAGELQNILDAKGNSVRGVAAFAAFSDELGLHAFDCTNRGSSLMERFVS